MKHFQYFLYDTSGYPDGVLPADDPRRLPHAQVDALLSTVLEAPPGQCGYSALCASHSAALVGQCMACGLLRRQDDVLYLDSPVILAEDIPLLMRRFAKPVAAMADTLQQQRRYDDLAQELRAGFTPSLHLYHILCGKILDGLFLDCLHREGIVSTGRLHASSLRYLLILYENAPALQAFANKLLCSYNRFTDGKRTLQTFGDADGSRVDFYRFSMQKALGTVPAKLRGIETLWDRLAVSARKDLLLDEVQRLAQTGVCAAPYAALLSRFGYAQDGKLIVPVYRTEHMPVITAMESLTEELLLEPMKALLAAQADALTCTRHGVAAEETANELYHIAFGLLGGELAARRFVAQPQRHTGEGRYLRSVECMV